MLGGIFVGIVVNDLLRPLMALERGLTWNIFRSVPVVEL